MTMVMVECIIIFRICDSLCIKKDALWRLFSYTFRYLVMAIIEDITPRTASPANSAPNTICQFAV